mmetsp:Transcript_19275/g.42809  ORF Transcript_19275/g.42809 Transcript_19275/m.42809 type:complete len:145 (-) Transcript_19275:219-653(-)
MRRQRNLNLTLSTTDLRAKVRIKHFYYDTLCNTRRMVKISFLKYVVQFMQIYALSLHSLTFNKKPNILPPVIDTIYSMLLTPSIVLAMTAIFSLAIIISAALSTPRVSSGPIPLNTSPSPPSLNMSKTMPGMPPVGAPPSAYVD